MLRRLLMAAGFVAAGTLAAPAEDLNGKSWDQIVAQAKAEGQVTWYVWYLVDDLRRFVAPFEAETGIRITIPEGTQSANIQKLLAERERTRGDIDVISASNGSYDSMDGAGLLMPLAFLPKDDGRIWMRNAGDPGGHFLAFWGNQTGIAYDPAHVDPAGLPQTPEEFAAFWAANPGRFGFNYENGGAGPAFYEATIREVTGLDFASGEVTDDRVAALDKGFAFFLDNHENFVITSSNADSIIRLSDGELWMVAAWEDHLSGLQTRGEVRKDIRFYVPSMGMDGGSNGVGIARNAAHPAAAAVFIAWLTSPEVQARFNAEFGTAPMNTAADDSNALVPREQRAYQTTRVPRPFRDRIEEGFVDKVILEM